VNKNIEELIFEVHCIMNQSVPEELSHKQASTSMAASFQILAKDPNAAISPFACMSSTSSVVLMKPSSISESCALHDQNWPTEHFRGICHDQPLVAVQKDSNP